MRGHSWLKVIVAVACFLLGAAEEATADSFAPAAGAEETTTAIPGAGAEAPFGLRWGMTKEEIEKSGIKLEEMSDKDKGAKYSANNLPKTVADIDGVYLQLGFSGRLHHIAAVSRIYENDPYGAEIRARYDEIVKALREKYGPGKEEDYVAEMYGDSRWSFGLNSNQNWLYTNFKTKEMSIQISCRANSTSDVYFLLIYEWKAGGEVEEKLRKEREKGAL